MHRTIYLRINPVPGAKTFADYKPEASLWITLNTPIYYPDYLAEALDYYAPVLARFGALVAASESSEALLRAINNEQAGWMRRQMRSI